MKTVKLTLAVLLIATALVFSTCDLAWAWCGPKPSIPAVLTGPEAGSYLESSATFTWTSGRRVQKYRLTINGDADNVIFEDNNIVPGLRSKTIDIIPQDGNDVTVTLSSLINGNWQTPAGGIRTYHTFGYNNDAQFISQNVPAELIAGDSAAVSVTFKNTGNSVWNRSDGYKLGSQNPHDNVTWGFGRVHLDVDESIYPGQEKTFAFTITAPADPGFYGFQWRMLRENVEWFGEYSPSIQIISPIDVELNLSPPIGTVYPKGTQQVTLVWDTIPETQSYGVRIMDNQDPGNVQVIDFYPSIEMVIDVEDGHSYTWWVHAIPNPGLWEGIWSSADVSGFRVRDHWLIDLTTDHHPFKGVGWNISAHFARDHFVNGFQVFDDAMPQFVRLIWYIEFYHTQPGVPDYTSNGMDHIYAFLDHAKQNNISVMIANWNVGGKWDDYNSNVYPDSPTGWPDSPFWLAEISYNDPLNSQDRFCHRNYTGDPGICSESDKISRNNVKGVESDHPYDDFVFAQTIVGALDYMINVRGFNIDFLSLWNEPNGDWAYHPRDAAKKYPSSFTGLYENVYNEIVLTGLEDKIGLIGMDDSYSTGYEDETKLTIDDYATSAWDPFVQAFSVHNYDGTIGSEGVIRYLYDRANGKPVIIGETGHKGADGCNDGGFDRWGNSIESTRLMISDIRYGAYAAARWWYNGGNPDTDCWAATYPEVVEGPSFQQRSIAIPANYNSLKILANTLPHISEDISVVETDFPDFTDEVDAVAINKSPIGLGNDSLVLWMVNKGISDYILPIEIEGLSAGTTLLSSNILTGIEPYEIEMGPVYSIDSSDPKLDITIPGNSILVLEQQ